MAVGTPWAPAAAPAAPGKTQTPAASDGKAAVELLPLLPLVPKRKRSKLLAMGRVDTMDAFCVECDCRSSKAAVPAAKAAAGAANGASAAAAAVPVKCSYYEEAAERQAGCLYSFLDAPAVLRFNSHIRTGYRAGLSYQQCCASVLSWHNETGNIWTHLLPLVLLLALLAGGQLQAWQGARLAFLANVGSIAACFAGSVAFHTFSAHHHQYHHWLKLDVCGVLLVLVGGGHMVLWWGVHCHPTTRLVFVVLYYGCAVACVRAALTATTALGRGLPMLALLLVRLSAFATRAVLEPASLAMRHYALMEVCSLAGGLLNVLRVPERWLQPADPSKPAPLDYLLNSHQLMHVLVAAAMWQLHLGAAEDYRSVSALLDGTTSCGA